MKIRMGFVSNSSSSSFVIVGIREKEVKDILIEYARKNCPDAFETYNGKESLNMFELSDHLCVDYNYDGENDNGILGYCLAYWTSEDCYLEKEMLPLKNILNHVSLKKVFEITGKGPEDVYILKGNGEC